MARRRSLRQKGVAKAPRPVVKTAPPTLKTTLLFLAVTLYLGGTVFKLCWQEWTLAQEGQILQHEQADVMAQNQALNGQIALARTNAGIEKLAREQLGLVKAEEIPVKTVVPQPQLAQAPATAPDANPPADKPHRVGLPPAMAAMAKLLTPSWK